MTTNNRIEPGNDDQNLRHKAEIPAPLQAARSGAGNGDESNGQAPPSAPTPPDPFSPESLRLSQDFGSTLGVRKVLTTVPVRKPHKQEFIRVRAGEDWRLQTCVLEDHVSRDTYLVDKALWSALFNEICRVCLFTACDRQGDVFLWPIKLPGIDGRSNIWNDSALAAANHALSRWIRVTANMSAGSYAVFEASADLPEPAWPELTFTQLLKLAFRDRSISDSSHPVLQALRGER